MNLEKPDPNEWAHKDKTIRNSRGKCLCKSLMQCRECAAYEPCQDRLVPAMCANLDRSDCVTCKVS